MVAVSSWGRLKSSEHNVLEFSDRSQIQNLLKSNFPGVAHGMGRSYGDVCLNSNGNLWFTRRLDRFISFDSKTGKLICEAGVLLKDIQQMMVPKGWILPVTPGTQLATVGGAIANDVHGKNHHVLGTFGNHINKIKLVRTNGDIIECGPTLFPEFFSATVGGFGMTGVITEVEIQLRPVAGPWLNTEIIPYNDLDEFFNLADASEQEWEHTVSWIDCLSKKGRGIFMRGNHTDLNLGDIPNKSQLTVPFTPPVSLVNKLSLKPFNMVYYYLNKCHKGNTLSHYESFFYPLDNLQGWNKMYGPRGFYQYQCVIPREFGRDAILEILNQITLSGDGSFLAVLKTFGDFKSVGMMSFPQSGVTLALDFPNKGNYSLRFFERLDAVVKEATGRIYIAKDARMSRDMFESGYPRLNEFLKYRDSGISSEFSRRLIGS